MRIRLAMVAALATFALSCVTHSVEDDIFQSVDKDSQNWTPLERSTLRSATIGWHNASAPFKKVILIRDGNFLCAVRFVNYRRGGDETEGSFWSSGEETLISAYEWNILQQENGRARAKDSGKATVKFSALKGFGHLVVAGGHENIRCGDRKFGWQYPAGIVFSQVPGSSMTLAPTRWESIEEIRLDDSKLAWYSLDQERKELRVPSEDL